MIDLTIIIVSWNCREYLENCLRSIDASAPAISYKVMVVDNNSTDATVELLRKDFTSVEIHANKENVGFAVANNQAMGTARSRYMMLLNPDTLVHPGALDALVRFMDGHPSVWAVGPAMLNRDGSPQRTGVRFPNSWNILCEALFLDRLFPTSMMCGRHKELYKDDAISRPVDYVQGACLMIRSDVFKKVGGMDEKFFMYFEETDWCCRMYKAGGQVYLCPDAKVTHFGGGDVGHYDEVRLVHYHRSLFLFYKKHRSLFSSILVRIIVAERSLIRVVVWVIVALAHPHMRSSAVSSIRGYLRTFSIIFEQVR